MYVSASKSSERKSGGFSHCGGLASVGSPNRSVAERGGAPGVGDR